jgi:hypothetical protein
MAEEMFMYTVTAGIFAFLVAVLFGTRAARKRKEPEDRSVLFPAVLEAEESESSDSSQTEVQYTNRKNIWTLLPLNCSLDSMPTI